MGTNTDKLKEQLWKKFEADFRTLHAVSSMPMTTQSTIDIIFNRLYSEIEERERSIKILAKEWNREEIELKSKLSQTEELLRLADEVILAVFDYDKLPTEANGKKVDLASESYNTLKNKP